MMSSSDGVLVRVKDVNRTFHRGSEDIQVLSGLNLEVPQGEFLALMGPSGSGKTTLLNLIGGLDRPSGGAVEVGGERIDEMPNRKLAVWRARHVGLVFQFYNLLPVLTAVENVELPLLVSGVRAGEARRRAQEGLAWVGLSRWGGHRPAELSGGQRQRVAIARALVNRPAIIWADEPTGDLDSETAAEVMGLMRRLNEENGQTFVLVTHSPEAARYAHRVIRMRDGQIVGDQVQTPYLEAEPLEIEDLVGVYQEVRR